MTFAELIHAVHTHPQHVVVPGLWGQGRAVQVSRRSAS